MDDSRIEQFRKMVEADPDNELGHFSLGRAYMDAARFKEAIACFEKVIDLNPQSSKAYQLLASAQQRAGDAAAALSTLRIGYDIANARGDIMPRNQMAALMRYLGEEPPEAQDPAPKAGGTTWAAGEGQIVCRRCSQTRAALAKPPFKGEVGAQIQASICPECWNEWIHMGTKVINELRLDFANPDHSRIYDRHMLEFLGLG